MHALLNSNLSFLTTSQTRVLSDHWSPITDNLLLDGSAHQLLFHWSIQILFPWLLTAQLPQKTESTYSRGCAHCKMLRKCCIFGCCTHFSHITVSPYAQWQHWLIQWVMPQWWMLCHSKLDLLANSLSTQPWLDLHSLSCMALQVQSMKGGIWTTK